MLMKIRFFIVELIDTPSVGTYFFIYQAMTLVRFSIHMMYWGIKEINFQNKAPAFVVRQLIPLCNKIIWQHYYGLQQLYCSSDL